MSGSGRPWCHPTCSYSCCCCNAWRVPSLSSKSRLPSLSAAGVVVLHECCCCCCCHCYYLQQSGIYRHVVAFIAAVFPLFARLSSSLLLCTFYGSVVATSRHLHASIYIDVIHACVCVCICLPHIRMCLRSAALTHSKIGILAHLGSCLLPRPLHRPLTAGTHMNCAVKWSLKFAKHRRICRRLWLTRYCCCSVCDFSPQTHTYTHIHIHTRTSMHM